MKGGRFELKVIKLQLPNAPLLQFNPGTKEWSVSGGDMSEIDQKIQSEEKAILELQAEIDIKKKEIGAKAELINKSKDYLKKEEAELDTKKSYFYELLKIKNEIIKIDQFGFTKNK